MRRTTPPALLALALALALAACGTTEKSGSVGDTLEANGLEVTVQRVDRRAPRPDSDITGLSVPAPGQDLIGVRVRVCSDHGGAIGAFDCGVETSRGDGELQNAARNYRKRFDPLRDGCGGGWIVFEVPGDAKPERVTFDFEDTGSTRNEQDRVHAKFAWALE